MVIPEKALEAMPIHIATERVKLHRLNEMLIAKKFENLSDYQKRMLIEKYNYAKKIGSIKGVNLPLDLLETENGVSGYIEYMIGEEFGSFADYCNAHQSLELDIITKYILAVFESVRDCHKNNIVNPDLATGGNVFYNASNGSIKLSDYHDMQVNNIRTDKISTYIYEDPILHTPKYFSNGLYSPNIDLYTLVIRYFCYATRINVPKVRALNGSMEYLLEVVGLVGTPFQECFLALVKGNINEFPIEEIIAELNRHYILSEYRQGEPRRFLKK